MDEIEKQFSLIDYILFSTLLAISFIIGIASACKGNKSPEEYLLGNRSLGPIPVAMSLLTSVISAINIVGFTSEVYSYGTQLSLVSVGCILGIAFSILVVMPVIHPLKLTSIHEYIEMRFNSSRLQTLMMALIFFNANVFMGICLYATSIALAAVTPLSYGTFIILMGVLCTLYSTIGGIRAVVWTDVFQLLVMTVGLLIFIIAGIVKLGGIHDVFLIASEGQRLEFFNMNPSLYERHNFYNTLAFGALMYGALFSVSQVNTQRICSVATLKDANIVLSINMIGMAIIQGFIFFGGLITYAFYAGCDPLLAGKIQRRDEILSFMIVDKLDHIYGLPGIFVATLIASTLSTYSSVLNAQVAIIWKDCLCKLQIFSNIKPWASTLINKILTFIIGGGFVGMAFLTSKAASIIQLSLSVSGVIFGCIFGTFLLGMCFPTSNIKGAWSGLIGSFSFLAWIYIGSLNYGEKPQELHYSTELCESYSLLNVTHYEVENQRIDIVLLSNDTIKIQDQQNNFESFPLMYLYGISYTLYSVIGPLMTIIIGLIVSHLTGPDNAHKTSPELISPIVLKFYQFSSLKTKKSYELKPM